MICFELSVNDQKLSTAGVPCTGTVTQTGVWIRRPGDTHDGLYVTLSGHETHVDPETHVDWGRVPLKVGDVVSLRIIERGTVDTPLAQKTHQEARVERLLNRTREGLEQLEKRATELRKVLQDLER